jgi:hypothetical protein
MVLHAKPARRLWQTFLHRLVPIGRRQRRRAVRTCPPRLEWLEDRVAPNATPPYTPTQIRTAYGINRIPAFNGQAADGTGQTIAIVIPFNNPNIQGDLAQFDQHFGLLDPPSFHVYNQAGANITDLVSTNTSTTTDTTTGVPGVDATGKAEFELAMDVEWAHAIAPGAAIAVVEANDFNSVFSAIRTAAHLPAEVNVSVVSMSFGFPEFSGETGLDTNPFRATGVTFISGSGDTGPVDFGYPPCSPNVVAVGGTTLTLNDDGSYNNESGWGGSGGGVSQFESEPGYQSGLGISTPGDMRAVPDVAFNADSTTGCLVYNSYKQPTNPLVIGSGTSLGTPCWAGLFAIVNQGRVLEGGLPLNYIGDPATGLSNPQDALNALYSLPGHDFHDITSGGNGGSTAGPGYDEVTGRGTPVANRLVPDLVAYHNGSQLVVTSQPPQTVLPGEPFSVVVKVEDVFGGVDTSVNSEQVSIGLANGDPTALSGTTLVSIIGGVASCTGLTLHVRDVSPIYALHFQDIQAAGTVLPCTATPVAVVAAHSPSIMVNTNSDLGSEPQGQTSLRNAFTQASTDSLFGLSDTIVFDPRLAGQTIFLSQGELELFGNNTAADAITVDASALAGSGGIEIYGNRQSGVIFNGAYAVFRGLTIDGGLDYGSFGGGIDNASTLTVDHCTVKQNSVTGGSSGGGGIFNEIVGNLTLLNSSVLGNSALGDVTAGGAGGGGIANKGTLTIRDSTLDNNSGEQGGAIANTGGTLIIANSTLSNNLNSVQGGGIFNSSQGDVTLINTTLTGNSASGGRGDTLAGGGGGIYNMPTGTVKLTNDTLTGNTSGTAGGGVCNGGTLTLQNTIVAGNTDQSNSAPDISDGPGAAVASFDLISSAAGNSIPTGAGSTNFLVVPVNVNTGDDNLKFSPLGFYGGPTKTIALLTDSPARGAGSPGLALDAMGNQLTTDQRGQQRTVNNNNTVDIGAFQTQPNPFLVTTAADASSLAGQLSLREAVNLANLLPGTNTITFDTAKMGSSTVSLTNGSLHLSGILGVQTIDGGGVVTISGSQANGVGNQASGVFVVDNGVPAGSPAVQATFTGLTVRSGNAGVGGGALTNNGGIVTVSNSTFTGNSAQDLGGAIDNESGTLTVVNSTLDHNSADVGGGIYNRGTLWLINSTLTGNTATLAEGGGVENSGSLTVVNSTLTGNTANFGGGIDNTGTLVLRNALVAGNTAQVTGPDVNQLAGSSLSASNSLISSTGGNSIDLSPNSGNILASPGSLGLAPLGNYGGPTQTIALLPGSPAIGAGNSALAVDATSHQLVTDQRGQTHATNVQDDIGAFQTEPGPVVDATADPGGIFGHLALREAVNLAAVAAGVGYNSTIAFDPLLLLLNGSLTITLANGVLELPAGSGTVTIDGGNQVTITQSQPLGIFRIDRGAQVVLNGLGIVHAPHSAGNGIANFGALTVSSCTVAGNSDPAAGGGIFNPGTLTLINSTFTGNHSQSGGAVFNLGKLTAYNSTFSGNSAIEGGALFLAGGTATLIDCTISGNSAGASGGGIGGSGPLTLKNTIVAGNTDTAGNPDINGGISNDLGNNLLGHGVFSAGPLDRFVTDPGLAYLNFYGGPTQTIAPLSGSAARGGGGALTTVTAAAAAGATSLQVANGTVVPSISGLFAVLLDGMVLSVTAVSGNTLLLKSGLTSAVNAGDGLFLPTDQRGFSRTAANQDIGAFQTPVANPTGSLVVTTGSDAGQIAGQLSLREAVNLAVAAALVQPTVPQIITLDPAIHTITLTKVIDVPTGIIAINATATIDGSGITKEFRIHPGATLNLSGGVHTHTDPPFGAIENDGTLTLSNCTFTNDLALVSGGAVYNTGTLLVSNCTFANNLAGVTGGAITNAGGTVTIAASTFVGNSVLSAGGAIENAAGTMTIVDSTFVNNSAPISGGAIDNAGTLILDSCTLSGNAAISGPGGGINNTGTLILQNTIVAGNSDPTGPDVFGAVGAGSAYNLVGDGSGLSGIGDGDANHNLVGHPALLAPLGNYGGPTQTLAPLPGSPALGAGANLLGLATDQRGFDRVVNGLSDIGAFQTQANPIRVSIATAAVGGTAGQLSLAEAINLASVYAAASSPANVLLDDSASAADTTYTITASTVQVNNQAPLSYAGAPSLALQGGGGNNVFNVEGTAAATPVTLNTGVGNDTVNVGSPANSLAGLGGGLTVTGGGGAATLNFNSAGDTGLNYLLTATTLSLPANVTSASGPPLVNFTGIATVVLNSGTGSSTVNDATLIQGVAAGIALTVNSGPDNILVVGNGSNTLDDIRGPLFINGQASDGFNVADEASQTGRTYTLTALPALGPTANQLSRSGPLPLSITYTGLPFLQMGGSSAVGGDTFNIESLAGNYLTRIYGGPHDVYNLSPVGQNLDALSGILDLQGAAPGVASGNSVLSINDQHNAAASTWIVESNAFVRGHADGSSGLQIYFGAFSSATVNAGSGNNVFNVEGQSPAASVTLNAGLGTTAVNVGAPGNTLDPLAGSLAVHGAGSTSVAFNNQGANPRISHGDYWSGGSADFYGAQHLHVDFTGVGPMTLSDPAATTNTHLFYTMPAVGSLTINGAGSDIITALAPAVGQNDWWITGPNTGNINNVVRFNNVYFLETGYSGIDVFHLLAGGSETAIGNPGSGDNPVLDLSGYTPGAVVTLPTSLAWGSVGPNTSFNGIKRIIGTAGVDTLVGPDYATTWVVSGANAGRVVGAAYYAQVFVADVAFSGFENLQGGPAADTFAFQTGGGVSGRIGGSGSDTLDYSAVVGNTVVDLALGTASGVGGGVAGIANVTGSRGNNLLVGDARANVLRGGTGRNVLIGGAEADTLDASRSSGDNLLIGGTTDFDTNLVALNAIFAEWTRTDLSFRARFSHLSSGGGLNGSYLLTSTTVHADSAPDTLIGSNQTDPATGKRVHNWFFYDADDTLVNFLSSSDHKTKVA